jgi:type I restriction enzyme S subunit
VWGIESIKNGRFTYKNKIFVTEKKAIELRSFAAGPGDIIISRSGTIDEICVIPNNAESGLISTNLLRVSLLDQIVNPQYFCFLFKGCSSVLDQLKELCSGSTRLFLNQNILKSLRFPVPPNSEQGAIVTKVEKLFALCVQLEVQIRQNQDHAEQLMQAVLKEAFSHNSEAESSVIPKTTAHV